jgi:carboxypeptidase Taq
MNLYDLAREHALIASSAEVLAWDQETFLPETAAAHRANQLAWLTAKAHELATSDAWKRALAGAEASDDHRNTSYSANVRELRRRFNRATQLPVDLVRREAQVSSLAKHAWAAAREASNFSAFAPHLEKLVIIAREKADRWGYPDEPFDALLETYERGTTTRDLIELFDGLRPKLRAIADRAVDRSSRSPARLPAGPYPIEKQQALNEAVARSFGFDFTAGRIDTTTHPFCTTLGPRDVRLTTRYDANDFTSSLFGVMHEAGHGLYEQGLAADDFGLPSGEAVSLGIHESQSRLWENHIGRSDAFWRKWFPIACEHFPQLRSIDYDDFLTVIRRAKKSFIRVETDEATYDLHILLRFDIERALIRGDMAVGDVPSAWNERFRALFGMTPPDDAHGCLQDIHWSMGGIGYFATYTLGNLNAAQLFEAAKGHPAVAAGIGNADYAPLLAWLRKHVHAPGGTLDPAELIRHATGATPNANAYLAHLNARYGG